MNMIPYALFNSKIVFEPFQYKPFFEFFEHTEKDLYIADEVGVGKTIEAGIIISELINGDRENDWIKKSLRDIDNPRILILSPPSLCAQWKEELETKFFLRVYDAYSTSLGMNYNEQIVVFAESWQQLEKIENDSTKYDLLIVDEVHNFRNKYTENPFLEDKKDSKRYESLRKICGRAKRKIFMSATPVFNRKADLKNEIDLLTKEYSSTASTKAVAKCLDFQPRIESILIELNQAEKNLYDKISKNDIVNPLTKSAVYLHEGCSSMPCLAKTLIKGPEKYIESIVNDDNFTNDIYYNYIGEKILQFIESKKRDNNVNIIEQFQTLYNELPEEVQSWKGFLEFLKKEDLKQEAEIYWKEIENLQDSKLKGLYEIIDNKLTKENGYAMEKKHIVIFAHYITTCNYIYEDLKKEENRKVYLATGENTKQEIDRSIEEFKETCRKDEYDSIIVCSDVCREGKNMQECQVIINYDLPFSPSIMQQRIGRIDRNGQKNIPLVFNLICDVPNDIHTYYEIIFDKIRMINSISGICGIDVIRETNKDVQNKIIKEWVTLSKPKNEDDNNRDKLSSLQKSYLYYLESENEKLKKENTSDSSILEEIQKVEQSSYSDGEVIEKMRGILFNEPNEELKAIREKAHCIGKNEIAAKIFKKDFKEGVSIKQLFLKYIEEMINPFKEKEILKYNSDADIYALDLSNIKQDFFRVVVSEQLFECFVNLQDLDKIGSIDMYFNEATIAFGSAVYKEVGNTENVNERSLSEFEEYIGERFEEIFVPLDPLCDVLNRCFEEGN